jgi:hypothetical protein
MSKLMKECHNLPRGMSNKSDGENPSGAEGDKPRMNTDRIYRKRRHEFHELTRIFYRHKAPELQAEGVLTKNGKGES